MAGHHYFTRSKVNKDFSFDHCFVTEKGKNDCSDNEDTLIDTTIKDHRVQAQSERIIELTRKLEELTERAQRAKGTSSFSITANTLILNDPGPPALQN